MDATTIARQLAGFAEMDQIVARYRLTAAFSADDGLGQVFDQVERLVATGRRDLGAQLATAPAPSVPPAGPAAAMSASRRQALLSTTPLGRVILKESEQPRPIPGPATALREEVKPAAERSLSPARRKALLETTPAGRRILADESRTRRR
jgi:hypothetical protein